MITRALWPVVAQGWAYPQAVNLPSLPPGGPEYLPWVIAGALFLITVALGVSRFRSDNASTRKAAAETTKISAETSRAELEAAQLSLSILSDIEASHQNLLRSITSALSEDPAGQPSEAELDALRERDGGVHAGVADHLTARKHARALLPDAVRDLHAVGQQRLQLEKEVQAGVPPRDARLAELREATAALNGRIDGLITELLESPRIFLSDEDPREFAAIGDLWLPPPGYEPPAEQPAS